MDNVANFSKTNKFTLYPAFHSNSLKVDRKMNKRLCEEQENQNVLKRCLVPVHFNDDNEFIGFLELSMIAICAPID